jgi:hypothetical protein
MGKAVVEIKCPKCQRETQYRTGLCEWCGAELFPHHEQVVTHLPDAGTKPLSEIRRLNMRDASIARGLHGVGACILLFIALSTRRRMYRLIPIPCEAWIALLVAGLACLGAGAVLMRRARQTCNCPRCGGIMVVKEAETLWDSIFMSNHLAHRYTYQCSVCGNITSMVR